MAIKITTPKMYEEYLDGVIDRASHHAPDVKDIIPSLAKWIYSNAKDITVREYAGKTANMMWCTINEKRYCFLYNHVNGSIKLLRNNLNGELLIEIDNDTPIQTIISLF